MTHQNGSPVTGDLTEVSYTFTETYADKGSFDILVTEFISSPDRGNSTNSFSVRLEPQEARILNNRRESMVKCVKRLGRLVGKADKYDARQGKVLLKLQKIGYSLYRDIFKSDSLSDDNLQILDRIFDRSSGQPGRIEVVSNDKHIDYQFLSSLKVDRSEVLKILDEIVELERQTPTQEIEDALEEKQKEWRSVLDDVMSSFLGRKYSFNRKISQHNAQLETGKVPTLEFRGHERMTDFNQNQIEELKKLEEQNHIELQDNFEQVKEVILEGQTDLVYLTCHVNYDDAPLLDFGSERIEDYDILELTTGKKNRMAFINACKSAPHQHDVDFTFTNHFILKLHYASVIGSHFKVPKKFAGEFAAKVWQEMFNPEVKGAIDMAMYNSSEHFIQKGQWGGFFYSIYGYNYIN